MLGVDSDSEESFGRWDGLELPSMVGGVDSGVVCSSVIYEWNQMAGDQHKLYTFPRYTEVALECRSVIRKRWERGCGLVGGHNLVRTHRG